MSQKADRFLVIDVESVGLHGEGFAVGWVEIDRAGVVHGEGRAWCEPSKAVDHDDPDGRAWVAANVPRPSGIQPLADTRSVRDAFWKVWQEAKARGVLLAADCCWPVESRFLAACVGDDPHSRRWAGPYPLIDVSSVILTAGLDPSATFPRREDELPQHDPLTDARQSARLLAESLRLLDGVLHNDGDGGPDPSGRAPAAPGREGEGGGA